jgi:hypothetical protein
VSVDDLLAAMYQRLNDFQRSQDRDLVAGGAVVGAADELWQAVTPADADHPTPNEQVRLVNARYALGWLYLYRFDLELPAVAHYPELARSLDYLWPIAGDVERIPAPLHDALGPTADPETQAVMGTEILRAAVADTDPVLLATAGELLAAALRTAPPNHRQRSIWTHDLAYAYQLRYLRKGASGDLDRMIELAEESLPATVGKLRRAETHAHLGEVYRWRYDLSGQPADLDRAIELGEQAVLTTRLPKARRASYRELLSRSYQQRYTVTGAVTDLERAIELGVASVAATPRDDPERPDRLSLLGNGYRLRFERLGQAADLELAITTGEQAVAGPATDPSYLMNVSLAYLVRFEMHGSRADLDRAIACAEQSLAQLDGADGEHDRHRSTIRSNLAAAYQTRFRHDGATGDLDRAIDLGDQALADRDHPNFAGHLNSQSTVYQHRYERTGLAADLNHAIELGEQCLAATPAESPHRSFRLIALGNAHAARFERFGLSANLDRAIDLREQALAATQASHPNRMVTLANLGASLEARHRRTSASADLDRAIELSEQAVAEAPAQHPELAQIMANLGVDYRTRFEFGGERSDLDRAVALGEESLARSSDEDANRSALYSALSSTYLARHSRDADPADIDRAIALAELPLGRLSSDHPRLAPLVNCVALGHLARLKTGSGSLTPAECADLDTRLTNLASQLAAAVASPLRSRVRAAHALGSARYALSRELKATQSGRAAQLLAETTKAATEAVTLLPLIAPREGDRFDQEHLVSANAGLVGHAVEAHCAAGDPVGAVEVAELGRGILLAGRLDLRTDLTELAGLNAELAARFRDLRGQLEAEVEDAAARRAGLWAEYDELVARIRALPGMSRFLARPRLADLRPATAGGAAVIVNWGQWRCDAVIVTADADPELVPLPDLPLSRLADQFNALHEAVAIPVDEADWQRRQVILTDVLGWLWDAMVGPVLRRLPGVERIWWLPTGPLGVFPLHAAGHATGVGALDLVVSSYIPTLRALVHAVGRRPPSARRQLAIAVAAAQDVAVLPCSSAEIDDLRRQFPATRTLRDEQAKLGPVLAALPSATWTHFACHATTDSTQPSRGGLHLQDGMLSIPDLSRLDLADAELAYLSACSTAYRDMWHGDESIHLASACQLAGFRHVIASLWPLADDIAGDAAHVFYQRMGDAVTADRAPAVLRDVTLDLRERYRDWPTVWAPLVHSGP